MQKIKSFFLSLIFSILGIAVGIGVGYLIVVFNEGGAFDSWKLLNSSFKFERIVDANSYIVWAESKNGKLLYYKDIKQTYCEDKDCNQWFETKEISSDAHLAYERPVEKDNSCQFDNLRFLRKPPGKIIECARGQYAGPEIGTVAYYALLDDGTIWKWDHHGEMIVYILLFLCLMSVGFILGMKALTVFKVRRRKKRLSIVNRKSVSLLRHYSRITGLIYDTKSI